MPSGEGGEAKCMMSRTRYVPQDPVYYVETVSLTISGEEFSCMYSCCWRTTAV
jgi:hypothetical protein